MPTVTTYMSLETWPDVDDYFDHAVLADNFATIDGHDHTVGKGVQVPTGGIVDGAITPSKITGLHLADVYANRPSATSALNGVRFFATDRCMEWLCVSGVWTLVSVFAPEVANLPGAPIDGQECMYLASAADGVKWHLRYRSAAAGSYKWEFVGGSPLRDDWFSNAAGQSDAILAVPKGLNANDPSLAVPLGGTYEVHHGATLATHTGAGVLSVLGLGLKVHTTEPTAANMIVAAGQSFSQANGFGASMSQVRRVTLAASQVLAQRYTCSPDQYLDRPNGYMTVTPVVVG